MRLKESFEQHRGFDANVNFLLNKSIYELQNSGNNSYWNKQISH